VSAPAGAVRFVPAHVTAALYAPLLAAMAVLASVRWWAGEPVFLRAAGVVIYAWAAAAALVIAAVLKRRMS
jgi:hypothetical protein